jgi:hypothetical protein
MFLLCQRFAASQADYGRWHMLGFYVIWVGTSQRYCSHNIIGSRGPFKSGWSEGQTGSLSVCPNVEGYP